MKSIKIIVFFFVLSCSKPTKSMDEKYLDKVQTLDGTINSFYEAISSDNGNSFDWDLYRYVMYPEAKLIRYGPEKNKNYSVIYYTADTYIDRYQSYMEEVGFYEKEIYREVTSYGPLSHALSVYESFENGKLLIRGINSFQLLNDGHRWWIINAYYTRETSDNPLPEKYLLKSSYKDLDTNND